MTDTEESRFAAWRGHDVVDGEHAKIGKVEDLYIDEETGQPEWLAVKTGLFGTKHSFVPLAGAQAEGDLVVVAHTKDKIVASPHGDQDRDGFLTPEEEAELYAYYGLGARTELAPVPGEDHVVPDTERSDPANQQNAPSLGASRDRTGLRLRRLVDTDQAPNSAPTSSAAELPAAGVPAESPIGHHEVRR